MSKLIQSLLLLAKIENNLFSESREVDVSAVVKNKFPELDEWMHEKKLGLKNEMKDIRVIMNPQLADTMISNLVINAIRHSDQEGNILVHSDNKSFMISNPGRQALDSQHIFDRFWKSADSEGTGLGLAIVKRICDQYGYSLKYEFKESTHFFTIDFI